jgi:hypothetical protein
MVLRATVKSSAISLVMCCPTLNLKMGWVRLKNGTSGPGVNRSLSDLPTQYLAAELSTQSGGQLGLAQQLTGHAGKIVYKNEGVIYRHPSDTSPMEQVIS